MGRPRSRLTEAALATAWRAAYDPSLGRATVDDVAEQLSRDPTWLRTLFHRLHPGVSWEHYRPAEKKPRRVISVEQPSPRPGMPPGAQSVDLPPRPGEFRHGFDSVPDLDEPSE